MIHLREMQVATQVVTDSGRLTDIMYDEPHTFTRLLPIAAVTTPHNSHQPNIED